MERNFSNNGDFLRFFAAFLVFIYHAVHVSGNGAYDVWVGQENLGSIGLSIFFVLSGMFVSRSLDTSSQRNQPYVLAYCKRRFWRIVPALYVFTVICFLSLSFASDVSMERYWSHSSSWMFLSNLTIFLPHYTLPGVFSNNPFPYWVNLNVWTIPLELVCYGLLLLVFAVRRWSLVALICFSLVAAYYYIVEFGHYLPLAAVTESLQWGGIKLFYLARYVLLFMVGVVLFRYRVRLKVSYSRLLAVCLLLAVLPTLSPQWGKAYFVLLFPYLVYQMLHINLGRGVQNFGRYGDISYGFYLYSFPIQQLCYQVSEGQWSLPLFSIITFVLSVIAGYVSFHIVEKRFLARCNNN